MNELEKEINEYEEKIIDEMCQELLEKLQRLEQERQIEVKRAEKMIEE